ncbi:Glycoside hydrolase, family 28 [Dillenia turbinata]|uniref:Glycoside hydrolase, family 28 n=1 Tax=Dillenia turbinata TaxID=194707 RepID=A0AAN8V6C2_9MAGN
MKIKVAIFMFFCAASTGLGREIAQSPSNVFDVINFGAVGDGETDDSWAFLEAWKSACTATGDVSTLVVPNAKFLLQSVMFEGPCKSKNIHVQIWGTLIAPPTPEAWKDCDHGGWIKFDKINGLRVGGSGQIDGSGWPWWGEYKKNGTSTCKSRPTAMAFRHCNNLKLSGLHHLNPPKNHITVNHCADVSISNVTIIAPEDSPNTDGIDMSVVSNVNITDSFIGTGDDCVAINRNSSFINVVGVTCGPGHGFRKCTLKGTKYGARIKTFQGGLGYARRISFEKITLIEAKNPIIIDQFYCNGRHDCEEKEKAFVIFLFFAFAFSLSEAQNVSMYPQNIFNVMDYGAVGNGEMDDSPAFLEAWAAACEADGRVQIIIPNGTFLLQSLTFHGPCKASSLEMKISGQMVAPPNPESWKNCKVDSWVVFVNVDGLILNGPGTINGEGSGWWQPHPEVPCNAPSSLGFHNCNHLQAWGLNLINSPRIHMRINSCNFVSLSNIHITAPQDSPNTDGIDVSQSTNVEINDCNIATGDDCVAISNNCKYINITGVTCGPGHGISIGSLGQNGAPAAVEEVHVRGCNLHGTQNGVRIKTWQGGQGYARKISFEHITLDGTYNPIIIDQFYCNGRHDCPIKPSAVKISDVTYYGVQGTSAAPEAIVLNCSDTVSCDNIVMNQVSIESLRDEAAAICKNANGRQDNLTTPKVPCLSG